MTPDRTGAPTPLVLLIVPSETRHKHAAILTAAGYMVESQSEPESTVRRVLDLQPNIIVAELNGASDVTFKLVRTLQGHTLARRIPMIVYGFGLTSQQIEATARAGAMWLQLEPLDGYKLLGAVRGVLSAKQPRNGVTP